MKVISVFKKLAVSVLVLTMVLGVVGCDNKTSESAAAVDSQDNVGYNIMTNRLEYLDITTGQIGSYSDGVNYSLSISQTTYSIAELKSRFPHGMYWNHEGNPNCTDPNSVTNKPCHNTNYDPTCCNLYSRGAQCHGWGLYMSYLYHGVPTETYGISHNIDDLAVGDVVRYRIGAYDHTIFITEVNGNNVKYSDCNMDLRCGIRWDVSTTKTELAKLIKAELHSVYDYRNQYSKTGFILSYAKRTITESYSIEDCCIEISGVYLAKGETEPTIKISRNGEVLKNGTDYEIMLRDNSYEYGTALIFGRGKYNGSVTKKYSLIYGDLSKCTVNYVDKHEYTGEMIKPAVEVVNEYGEVINPKYYVVNYDGDCNRVGTHKICIYPYDNTMYRNEKKVTYEVFGRDINKCLIEYKDKVPFVSKPVVPDIYISDNGERLFSGHDYTVTYMNNDKVGMATAIITGIGSYSGTKTIKYEVYSYEPVTKEPVIVPIEPETDKIVSLPVEEETTSKPVEEPTTTLPVEKPTINKPVEEETTSKPVEMPTTKPDTEKPTDSTEDVEIVKDADISRDTSTAWYSEEYVYNWDEFDGATKYVIMRAYCKKYVPEENLEWKQAAVVTDNTFVEKFDNFEANLLYKIKVYAYKGEKLIGYTKSIASARYELDINNIHVSNTTNGCLVYWDAVCNVNGYSLLLYKNGEIVDWYSANTNSYTLHTLDSGNYKVSICCAYDSGSDAYINYGWSSTYEFVVD